MTHIMKAVETGEKEAIPQEAEVLQTYLVGIKQILEEKELWIPPVESEVMVLENTGTLISEENSRGGESAGAVWHLHRNHPGQATVQSEGAMWKKEGKDCGVWKLWHA